MKEIEEGESELVEQNGELIRRIAIAGINVFYEDETGRCKLTEDKQVFKDGRVRRRKKGNSISEKMKPNEDPEAAFKRGLSEELPEIADSLGKHWADNLQFINTETLEGERMSDSFPGLKTKYVIYLGDVIFTKQHYRLQGYVEHQYDKSTYFTWKKVKPQIHHA